MALRACPRPAPVPRPRGRRFGLCATLLILLSFCGVATVHAQGFFGGNAATGDLFGQALDGVGDLNNDGYEDFAVGDPGDDSPGTDQGRVFVYFGRATNLSSNPDLILTVGNGGDEFGFSVVGLGHFNGDEYDDLAVGAPFNDGGGQDAGRVYVFYGGGDMDATADLTLTGQAAGDHFGWSVGGGFDFNGDGFHDLAAGSPDRSNLQLKAGDVRVFYGASSPGTTAAVTLVGDQAQDQFGFSLHGAGHFNGDGFDDLVVGAPQQFQLNKGKAYIFLGRSGTAAPVRHGLEGVNGTDRFGWAVAGGGNVNGDGYDDIVVGAPRHDAGSADNGAVYLFLGGPAVSVEPDAQIDGRLGGDHLGMAVAMDGDYNKDGRDDVATGSPDANDEGSDSGNIEIWYGASPLDTGSRILITGPVVAPGFAANDRFGFAVGFVDYNGDGYAELLGGAPDGNQPSGETVGLATLNFFPGTLVPIALSGFEAQLIDAGALLSWRTAGDDQPLGFHVERQTVSGGAWQRRTAAPLVAEGDGAWRFIDPLDGLDAGHPGPEASLAYRLVALQRDGGTTLFGPFALATPPTLGDRLMQNAPNPVPAGADTRIRFQSARESTARLILFDLSGRPVRHLLDGTVAAGVTELTWNGTDDSGRALPAGAYFYRLDLGGRVLSRKLLLRR